MLERRSSLHAAALLLACVGCDSPSAAPTEGPPASIEIVSGNRQEFTVGEMLPERLTVRVLDGRGSPVANQVVNFRVVAGDGRVIAGAGATDEQGIARDRWTLGTVAGDTQRADARAIDRTTGNAVVAATFTAVGRPAGPAAVVAVGASVWNGTAGLPLADSVAVKVMDTYGNAVPAAAVVWRVKNGGGAVSPSTSTTDAQGVARALWTLGARMDSAQVLDAAAGVGLATEIQARATNAPAVVVTRLSGDAQRGPVAAELADPLVVWVTLPDGRPLSGATVTWSTPDGGSISSATADAAGRVVGRWTLGTVAEQQTATAAVAGTAVVFTATAHAALPNALTVTGGNGQTAVAGSTLPEPLATRVTDRYGNPVPRVPVYWAAATSDGGSVHPDTSWTDADGLASTSWTLGSSSGAATITARAGDAPPLFFTARAEPRGTKLVFVSQPTVAEAGTVNSPLLRVAIQNEFGSTDVTATSVVTLTVVGDTTHAVVSGALSVKAVAGVATFADLQIDRPGSFQLVASAYELAASSTTLRVGLTAAALVYGASHLCILAVSNVAYCWGNNFAGQLGDGTTAWRGVPAAVAGGLRFSQLSTTNLYGYQTCGIALTGDAYCWGDNMFGGTVPAPVPGGLRFIQLSPGWGHTCGVTDTNDAYCWGQNDYGQLGAGAASSPYGLVRVAGGLKFAQVSTGSRFTCGVTTEHRLYCWGHNNSGQLGDGTLSSRSAPTPVNGSLTFVHVSGGDRYACAVTTDHAAYCWGANDFGRLGDGTTARRLTPSAVAGGVKFTQLSAAIYQTCGVATDNAAYCWGDNSWGRLGDGTTQARLEPSLVKGGLSFVSVHAAYTTCGVTTSKRAYCWGSNDLVPQPVAH